MPRDAQDDAIRQTIVDVMRGPCPYWPYPSPLPSEFRSEDLGFRKPKRGEYHSITRLTNVSQGQIGPVWAEGCEDAANRMLAEVVVDGKLAIRERIIVCGPAATPGEILKMAADVLGTRRDTRIGTTE